MLLKPPAERQFLCEEMVANLTRCVDNSKITHPASTFANAILHSECRCGCMEVVDLQACDPNSDE